MLKLRTLDFCCHWLVQQTSPKTKPPPITLIQSESTPIQPWMSLTSTLRKVPAPRPRAATRFPMAPIANSWRQGGWMRWRTICRDFVATLYLPVLRCWQRLSGSWRSRFSGCPGPRYRWCSQQSWCKDVPCRLFASRWSWMLLPVQLPWTCLLHKPVAAEIHCVFIIILLVWIFNLYF